MPARTCVDCGTITTHGTRCPTHARAREARHHRVEYDTRAWRWARDRTLARHRKRWGELCPGWKRKPHLAGGHNPLTVDHVIPLAAGGHLTDPTNLDVLCRSCNGRKG
jgi:5-methylcytosine-specific restriction protein A